MLHWWSKFWKFKSFFCCIPIFLISCSCIYIYDFVSLFVCILFYAQHKNTTYMFSISLVLRSHDCSWRRLQNTGICRDRMPLNRVGSLTAYYLDTGPRFLRSHPKNRLSYVAFDDKQGYWGPFRIGIPTVATGQAEIEYVSNFVNSSFMDEKWEYVFNLVISRWTTKL